MADSYYELKRSEFEGEAHRDYIGGMWDEIGRLQFEFMRSRGLQPESTLIDVGCGSLRGGVRFIDYLEPFHYFGTDVNPHLIAKGIERELSPESQAKIGEHSFRVSEDFDFGFDVPHFDYGIAVSLFTHLSPGSIHLCLSNLRPKFTGGRFYATIFEVDPDRYDQEAKQAFGVVTHPDENPYHQTVEQIADIAHESGWSCNWIGDFGHPRNQKVVEFY